MNFSNVYTSANTLSNDKLLVSNTYNVLIVYIYVIIKLLTTGLVIYTNTIIYHLVFVAAIICSSLLFIIIIPGIMV